MDPLSAILFFVVGCALVGLYTRFFANTTKITTHDVQLGRLVSDAESEKGTRRRINHDIENRLRRLEHRAPLPPNHDDPPEAT